MEYDDMPCLVSPPTYHDFYVLGTFHQRILARPRKPVSRVDNLAKFFPNWPRNFEKRSNEIKMMDCREFYCMGSCTRLEGVAYQFKSKPTDLVAFSFGKSYPAEPAALDRGIFTKLENGDEYWETYEGFRGLFVLATQTSYVEIPSPERLQKLLGRSFSVVRVKGVIGDLEFATLQSQYDFVISTTDSFYHDMMGHFSQQLFTGPRKIYVMKQLHRGVKFYQTWKITHPDKTTNRLIEHCLGLAADLQLDLTVEAILLRMNVFELSDTLLRNLDYSSPVYDPINNIKKRVRELISNFFDELNVQN